MNRRKILQLIIPSLLSGTAIVSCKDPNPSLKKPSFNQLPSMSDKSMEKFVRKTLESGKELKFVWDCGGDEIMVYLDPEIPDDKKPSGFPSSTYNSLVLYIINFLDLPSVGEFSMEGKGEFVIIENDKLVINFETSTKWDYLSEYNAKTKEVIITNEDPDPEIEKGTKTPF